MDGPMKACVAFMIVFGLIVGYLTISQYSDCNSKRGVFVKTALWYDCIEKGKH